MAAQSAADMISGRRGADLEAIARFTERVPYALPPLYMGFLREFGDNAGGVGLGGDGSSRLTDILDFYDDTPHEVPHGSVVIQTPAISAAVVLRYEAREPTVCHAWQGTTAGVYAPSFAHHLFRSGWLCAHWPNREDLTTRTGLADVERYALAIGLERQWFGGGEARCFVGDGAVVDLERTGDVTRISVLGRLTRARATYAQAFVRKFGARWLNRRETPE